MRRKRYPRCRHLERVERRKYLRRRRLKYPSFLLDDMTRENMNLIFLGSANEVTGYGPIVGRVTIKICFIEEE